MGRRHYRADRVPRRVPMRLRPLFDPVASPPSCQPAGSSGQLHPGNQRRKRLECGQRNRRPQRLPPMSEVTRILSAIEQGDPHAAEELLPLVYDELRKFAGQKLAKEMPGQTLQATALVHEAYLRLVDGDKAPHFNSRGHFFAACAEAMRRILVDQARRKQAAKRGGQGRRVPLDAADVGFTSPADELLDIDDALT